MKNLIPSMKLLRFFPFHPESHPEAGSTTTTQYIPAICTAQSVGYNFPYTCAPIANASTVAPTFSVTSPWLTDLERIGYMYVMPLICMAGIIFNSMTILVLTKRMFGAPTYIYLNALAAADLCTSLLTLPIGAVRCGPCIPEENGFGRLFYEVYIWVPFSNIAENVSSWMTLVLAMDRVLTLKTPLHERSMQRNRRRASFIIFGVVCSAIIMNLPFLFATEILYSNEGEYRVYFSEFGDSDGFAMYSWFRAVLVQFIPLAILIVVNAYLVYQVRQSQARCRRMSMASRSTVRERAQMRLTFMLIGTLIMFILGHISIAFAYTVIFQAVFGEEKSNGPFYANWRVCTHLIAMLSYALDFVVYCLVNRFFREATIALFTCDRGKRKVHDISSTSSKDGPKSTGSSMSVKTKRTSLKSIDTKY